MNTPSPDQILVLESYYRSSLKGISLSGVRTTTPKMGFPRIWNELLLREKMSEATFPKSECQATTGVMVSWLMTAQKVRIPIPGMRECWLTWQSLCQFNQEKVLKTERLFWVSWWALTVSTGVKRGRQREISDRRGEGDAEEAEMGVM